mmetsp:Transcript_6317/g.15655  ORF Transcript_6317/g.15655 Transcript_6317/m.15655 type:complete len:593 (-) Transcript_6317:67-1845(-)
MKPITVSSYTCGRINILLLLFHVGIFSFAPERQNQASAFSLYSYATSVNKNSESLKGKSQRRRHWYSFPSKADSKPHLQHPCKSGTIRRAHPPISDRNVELNTTEALVYDPDKDRFVRASSSESLAALYSVDSSSEGFSERLRRSVKHAFVPEGVNKSYFHFMRWRICQRFINSYLHVLGTQSLIMGLGINSAKNLGVSAALTWVLKDALGKLTRLVWASKMGRRFDSDAKRWRFRASLVYALGNYLEIITYVNPSLFLLWATIANSCKQVAMLTSSATRTSLYNSFRDGKRENIADITAKGEAQIAIVDLVGIAVGVSLSKVIGTSIKNVLTTYFIFQLMEIFCLFQQIQGVEYKVMNFERMTKVIESFCDGVDNRDYIGTTPINGGSKEPSSTVIIPTPGEVARSERIFLPPHHLRRRMLAFGSLGRAKLNPEELSKLMGLFGAERYMLVVGKNLKRSNSRTGFFRKKTSEEEKIQQGCHIVLHEEASNLDVMKSTLALHLLRRKLLLTSEIEGSGDRSVAVPRRSSDCWELLEETKLATDRLFPLLLRQLSLNDWASPSDSMFGRVSRRASWPLSHKASSSMSSSSIDE